MPYHLQNTQLRVVHKYTHQEGNTSCLKNTRLILLEHILETTAEFINHLIDVGVEIHVLIAKPYSVDEDVLRKIKDRGITVLRTSYDELENTDILDRILVDAITKSTNDGKQILIAEVGGYFAKPLTRLPMDAPQVIAGVIEDTTFGHNRYVEAILDIPVPVFSVSRSALKEIEARFVGRDAVAAMEDVLRRIGVSIAGRNALVIGYGMIGANVARALRNHDLNVQVYDKLDYKNLQAFIDGFYIHKKQELIKNADIIFAATASEALGWDEIEECKTNVILASVGSKNTEFDVKTMNEQAVQIELIPPNIKKYK